MKPYIFFISFAFTLTSCNGQNHKTGDLLDTFNGVNIYYNGGMTDTHGRNTKDGYNVGLKYQCVEFVKRYYLEHYNHKMPESYGHAKDFYIKKLADGAMNKARNLKQFCNGSKQKPQVGDLVVFDGWAMNPYGHVAIISLVKGTEVEVVQQNVGSTTREKIGLVEKNGIYKLNASGLLGWLRIAK